MKTNLHTKNNKLPLEAMEVCERLKLLRKMIKMSQKDFAATIGISQGHLCVIEKHDHAPSDTLLLAICYRHKVNEEWLKTGAGEPFPLTVPNHGIPIYKQLPEICTEIKGSGDVIGYLSLPGLSKEAFAIYQRGDFMAPTVRAQDLVICEPTDNIIAHDDLILFKNKWKTCIIRRYREIDGKKILSADNLAYNSFELEDFEQSVVAKIVMVLRSVNL